MPFTPGNKHASTGGHARAAKLSADRRAEIARSGFDATTQKHFSGDPQKHIDWFVRTGLAAQDSNYPAWMRVWKMAEPHPKHVDDARRAVSESNGDVSFEDCRPGKEM